MAAAALAKCWVNSLSVNFNLGGGFPPRARGTGDMRERGLCPKGKKGIFRKAMASRSDLANLEIW